MGGTPLAPDGPAGTGDSMTSARRTRRAGPTWGIWDQPEAELQLLPEEIAGQDAIELGCGTAYVSAWLARARRPAGRHRQLGRAAGHGAGAAAGVRHRIPARARQRRAGAVPGRLASTSPSPSTARRSGATRTRGSPRRPGCCAPAAGWSSSATTRCCSCARRTADAPAGDRLVRDYFGLHRLEWADDDSVEFALPYGEWFRLLRANGFEVEDLLELQAPADASKDLWFVTAAWARRWPSEHVWKLVKRG